MPHGVWESQKLFDFPKKNKINNIKGCHLGFSELKVAILWGGRGVSVNPSAIFDQK
jgi:hypothetical protein